MLFKKPDLVSVTEDDGSKPKLQLNKKSVIALAVIGVLALGLIGKTVFTNMQVNYWDTMNAIFSNELGTFKYVFDVRVAPKGSLITVKTDESVNLSQLKDIEMVEDSTEGIEDESGNKHEWGNWDESATIKIKEWKYPNYQITVEGVTTSKDPLTSQFTIGIATEYYNSKFSEVIIFEDNCYIDIESMREWLLNSGDSYLYTLAEDIPEGIKYLVASTKEFGFTSGYAESSEKEASRVYGFDTMYKRFINILNMASTIREESLGNKGVSSTFESAKLDLGTEDCWKFISSTKPYLARCDVYYASLAKTGYENGLYTEEQYKQVLNERDNILAGFSDLNSFMSTMSKNNTKMKMEGFCREFVNGKGNDCFEGTLKVGLVVEDTDYLIQVTASRSGNGKDITVPQGSQVKYKDLQNKDLIENKLYSMIDYFNFTSIDFDKQLTLSTNSIATDLMYKFIDIINERGCSPHYIRMSNVNDFIKKYANYEETSESTEKDLECAKLVSDFYKELNDLTGGVIKYQDVVVEGEVEKYPNIDKDVNNIRISTSYNTELSTAGLVVLDVEVTNKGTELLTINTTDFSLKTLLNSVYPANNTVLLQSYDLNFDVSSLVNTIELPAKSWDTFRLYFVLSTDGGHMDLFLNDTQLGAVIEY